MAEASALPTSVGGGLNDLGCTSSLGAAAAGVAGNAGAYGVGKLGLVNAGNCDNCISSALYQNFTSGQDIIQAMFTEINSVLGNVEVSFFTGIVTNVTFQQVIGIAILLYVVIYGLMITFNLGSYKTSEITTRLFKLAIVYMMTSVGAFTYFQNWVATPVIGALNGTINEFNTVAEGGSSLTTVQLTYEQAGGSGALGTAESDVFATLGLPTGAGGLDASAFSNMFGASMTTVFSQQLLVAILAMVQTGFFGWLISIFLAWSLVEFLLMMVGALVTYAKAIIGLAFLFAMAPLFFIFLLFDNTRQIFFAWVAEVVTFALQPVLLFAFLSFYVALITQAVPNLLVAPGGKPTDFCWLKWFDVPGTIWSMFTWHPTYQGAEVTQSWVDPGGNQMQEPINVSNALYFLMLCHLGRSFTRFIETISRDLGEGSGGGITTNAAVKNFGTQVMRFVKGK